MRVNIYSQEFTDEIRVIAKEGENEKGERETFYGIRLYFKSTDVLHHTATDDDRSAVTFWLPKSIHNKAIMANTFYTIGDLIKAHMGTGETP